MLLTKSIILTYVILTVTYFIEPVFIDFNYLAFSLTYALVISNNKTTAYCYLLKVLRTLCVYL